MFTAVYLCCSPASQLWLAPFTRPQLQLQLNKTSNRDTSPFCLRFSPSSSENDLSHRHGRRKKKNKMLIPIHSPFFSLPTCLHLLIFPIQHCGGSNNHPPTHQDLISLQGSHPQSTSPPLPVSLFLQKNCAFYVMEACCSL